MNKPDMLDRCMAHARIAAKQASMKGLDRGQAGCAFMVEAIQAIYGVDQLTALTLAKASTAYCWEFLQAKNIAEAEARGEDTTATRNMVAELRASNPDWMQVKPDVVAKAEEKSKAGKGAGLALIDHSY